MDTSNRKLIGKYIQAPISDKLEQSIKEGPPAIESNSKAFDFNAIQTYNPMFDYIWRSHSSQPGQWFGTEFRISQYNGDKSIIETNISVDSSQNIINKETSVFRKVVHLLEPMRVLENKYTPPKTTGLPWHTQSTYAYINKIQSPHNQAYVDTTAAYLVSRLREENISPHFSLHYGSLTMISNTYLYNITDDYQSYKKEKWFWSGITKHNIPIIVTDTSGNKITDIDVLSEYQSPENNIVEVEELIVEAVTVNSDMELVEYDIPMSSDDKNTSDDSSSEDSDTSDDSSSSNIRIFLEFKNMPIMMSFFEKQSGSMENLLFDSDEVGAQIGSKNWEERWTAWIFQIIVALTQMQEIYDMTHNDLHTNNVLWSKTDKEYIYYKTEDNQVYKVPTYGKIFRIIDFGRAIYNIGGKTIISDDYDIGNDAAGQYNFGPIYDPDYEEITPNYSFDLCRLSISCIESLFPQFPKKAKGKARVMSKEEGRTMYETNSSLFNLLWSWLVMDNNENVYLNKDNTEKYPSFDLYVNIAENVHDAVPSEQISKSIFNKFKWNKNINSIVYPIYA